MKTSLENLAIIILNYNSAKLCLSLVNKLLSLDVNAHIFVVDNCSTDKSQATLSRLLPELSNIHLVLLNNNTGYANGNNAGIKEAVRTNPNTDAFVIMNPDIYVEDVDTLIHLYNAVLEKRGIGAITALTIYNGILNQPNECAWRFMTKTYMMFGGTLLGRLFVKDLKYDCFNKDADGLALVNVVQGCFFMISRQAFEDAGLFDTHTFLYSEESILAKRLEKKGYKNAVLTNLYIQHNHQEKDKKLQKVDNKIFDMNCYYSSRKYYIREYSGCGNIFKTIACLYLDLDYHVKVIMFKLRPHLKWGGRKK